jgi:hypothetical protein
MEGKEKPYMDKYKEIVIDCNYDASCRLNITSGLGLRKF